MTTAAAIHAAKGRYVFPCLPGDKRPAVDRWERRACADPETVRRYWPSARHNIGIACGPSNLVVVDLDTHGELPEEWALPGIRDGKDVFAQLCEWASQPWPTTHAVATPSGGWHLYYQAPEGAEIRNSASLLGPMVDVRAAGGYVIAEGSVIQGRAYEVLDDGEPGPLPAWISNMLTVRSEPRTVTAARGARGDRRFDGLVRVVKDAREGQRNHALYWAACRAAELDEEYQTDAADALLGAASEAGLSANEAWRTVRSAMRGAVR